MTLMNQIEEKLKKERIRKIIEAIEFTGCIIVNPNYNPVTSVKGTLMLRSADHNWLVEAIAQNLQHLEQEKGRNDSE